MKKTTKRLVSSILATSMLFSSMFTSNVLVSADEAGVDGAVVADATETPAAVSYSEDVFVAEEQETPFVMEAGKMYFDASIDGQESDVIDSSRINDTANPVTINFSIPQNVDEGFSSATFFVRYNPKVLQAKAAVTVKSAELKNKGYIYYEVENDEGELAPKAFFKPKTINDQIAQVPAATSEDYADVNPDGTLTCAQLGKVKLAATVDDTYSEGGSLKGVKGTGILFAMTFDVVGEGNADISIETVKMGYPPTSGKDSIETANVPNKIAVGGETEVTTEVVTEGQTEATTEAQTEAPTEAKTEAPTEEQTEAPTEAKTEAQTEAPTEAQTEAQTEAPTEAKTEAPTEAKTEAATEVQTEAKTETTTAQATPDHNTTSGTTETTTYVSGNSSSVASGGSSGGGGGGGTVRRTKTTTTTVAEDQSEATSADVEDSTEATSEKTESTSEAPASVDVAFNDLSSAPWAADAINALAAMGAINGVSEGEFAPMASCKRADFAIVLSRLVGLEGTPSTNFDDVTPDKYYYNYVGLAKEAGLVNGYGNGKFGPENFCTRAELMVMVANALKVTGADISADEAVLAQFSDEADIPAWARPYIAFLVENGVVNGSNGKINPNANVTRAEVAVIMYNVVDILSAATTKEAAEEESATEDIEVGTEVPAYEDSAYEDASYTEALNTKSDEELAEDATEKAAEEAKAAEKAEEAETK